MSHHKCTHRSMRKTDAKQIWFLMPEAYEPEVTIRVFNFLQ